MTRERALGSGKLQAGYRFQVGQMLEPARASKRMPITRHNGFVIFRTGSADPLIAFAIDVLNGTAYVHSSKRCLRGPILQLEIDPRLRNRRPYNG
jgi:hypothetical protein